MARRSKHRIPELSPNYWIKEGDNWLAKPDVIRATIAESKFSDCDIRRNLGAAYDEFLSALEGKAISVWAANIIESGIKPREELCQSLSSPSDPHKNLAPTTPVSSNHK